MEHLLLTERRDILLGEVSCDGARWKKIKLEKDSSQC